MTALSLIHIYSVARALKYAAPDADIRICNQPHEIDAADRVVFPGQGAMADCMRTLNESGLREAVVKAARGKPLLGVCVGEQMLFDSSEEGATPCLGPVSYTHLNPSSSLIQSRITGNLVFMLLPPLSHRDIFAAYVLAAVVRGLAVGLCVWVVALFFVSLVPANPLWLLVFAVLACGIMGVLGLIAGLWSEKFDQLAAFQNFLIMPATFLSGVFYSIHTLPAFWQGVSHWNPCLLYTSRCV